MEVSHNSDAALISLLVAFGYVDGVLDPKELTVIREACELHGIDPALVDRFVTEYGDSVADYSAACHEAAERITAEELRERAMAILCDVAAADEVFRHNEKEFLRIISDSWGAEPVAKPELFDWDSRQSNVIVAPHSDRIEVHAGPGMGKTAVACARVSELIKQGVEPTSIWLLSFTRTAVTEIRDRISQFAEDSTSTLGVKIGTIDSRAWRIRCGFTEGEVEKLFGGYDTSIEDAIEIVRSGSREVSEFFEGLEHIVIDEAQDITGLRARLIICLLQELAPTCGVTIFADPAQAIYGFTTDGVSLEPEDRGTLLDLLRTDGNARFVQHELQQIHRTSSPNLVDLIEDLRLDIYVNEEIDSSKFDERRELIFNKANRTLGPFSTDELKGIDNSLVLFRQRSEVLLASALACGDSIPHRIRMSGLPTIIHPWIGQLFSSIEGRFLSRTQFEEEWDSSADSRVTQGTSRTEAWDTLSKLAVRKGRIDVAVLRKKLARGVPDIAGCVPDLGTAGPIIGTIHASKGREADEVILRLPADTKKYRPEQLDEESRVMFVGASRARSSLVVGNGFLRVAYASSLKSGRSFYRPAQAARSELPTPLVEIGRAGDVDPYSVVSKSMHSAETARAIQETLAELSTKVPCPLEVRLNHERDFQYEVWTTYIGDAIARPIAMLTQAVNSDFWEVLNRMKVPAKKLRPPDKLNNVFLIGVTTFVASDDDPRLVEVSPPYSTSGFWMVPVVIGYPKAYFRWRRRPSRS